jgi:hypothetical protein
MADLAFSMCIEEAPTEASLICSWICTIIKDLLRIAALELEEDVEEVRI